MARLIKFIALCGWVVQVSVSTAAAQSIDYLKGIKPLLSEKCYSCHGVLKQEAGLRLETRSLMQKGGDSGPAIQPGDAASSLLVHRIGAEPYERMPPEEQGAALKPDEIARIERWIDAGAPAPDEPIPMGPEQHWAFQPPHLAAAAAQANSIDALLNAKLAAQSLTAVGPAERPIQIRRLYLDLIGLPPTLAQLNDTRPWEQIVDQLLASPQHGERWARHWMDIWRYSDWYGLGEQLRYSQKHMWHWRDWIVESLNTDKGYDRMIREMLAGDELAPLDPAVVAGTGFLARNYYLFNRTTWLDSTIEHTGKAFLGLTLNCAKCHDHKYDPITQRDYYRFRAIFEPHQVRLDPVPGQTDLEQDGLPRVFDDHLDAKTFLHIRGNPKQPDRSAPISPGVPEFLASFAPEIQPVELPPEAYAPVARDYVQHDHLAQAEQAWQVARRAKQAAAQRVAQSEGDSQAGRELALTTAKCRAARLEYLATEAVIAADAEKCKHGQRPSCGSKTEINASVKQAARLAAMRQADALQARAKYELRLHQASDSQERKAAKAMLKEAAERRAAIDNGDLSYRSLRPSRKALETPEHQETDYSPFYEPNSTGRRLALARWITSRHNPLTARVAVNHVWLRHFGQPLVESVFDFGLRAKRPLHAEILDYLAVELMRSGWSFKHLHRLIVTSDAYRRSSSTAGADALTKERDPTNQFYWRMNSRRMESQVIRDSLLKLAGDLDLTMGGPSVPTGQGNRRSLYFKHSRDDRDRFLKMFDDADQLRCYRRTESVVPQQALALSNSALAINSSKQISQRISRRLASDDRLLFVATAYRWILGRAATDDEKQACIEFYETLWPTLDSTRNEDRRRRANTLFVHALLNHNDFVSIR